MCPVWLQQALSINPYHTLDSNGHKPKNGNGPGLCMVPSEASATLDEAQKALEGAVAGVLAETAWLVELLTQDAAAPAAHAVSHDFHTGQRFFLLLLGWMETFWCIRSQQMLNARSASIWK